MGKMIDLGKKYPKPEVSTNSDTKDHVSYPSIYIDGKRSVPGKVGSTIHAKVKLRKVSHSIRHEKSGTTHSQSFDVMAIEPGEGSDKEEAMDAAMNEDDHQDGGKVNSQSQIEAGLNAAEDSNQKEAPKKFNRKKG